MGIKEKILKLIFLFFFLLGTSALAEEVDDFTPVNHVPRDASPVIDLATNALLDELVTLLNKSHLNSCSDPIKYQIALKKLDQNFTAIGNGLRAGKEIKELLDLIIFDPENRQNHQKRLLQVQETWLAEFTPEKRDWFANLFSSVEYFGPRENRGSIYEKLAFLTCCTSRINVGGVYVGLDKVDHFFGNAGLLFEQFLLLDSKIPLKERLETIMQINVRQEHSLWGLKGLSPKSYADLAANWHGLRFYRELFDEVPNYIRCEAGVFQRTTNRSFHIGDYLDESWNESSNCSSFVNERDLNLFNQSLKQAGTQCPRDPAICKNLVQKHQKDSLFVKYSLNPRCSGSKKDFIAIEEAIPISWDEVELSFRGFTWPIIKDIATKKWAEILQGILPDFLKDKSLKDGEQVFTQFRTCRQFKGDARIDCLQQYTEPGLKMEQLNKFASILEQRIDFSHLANCPAKSDEFEKTIHKTPIGDLSLCFQTHYRNTESIGRVYFRRHNDRLKVVLLRM